MGIAEVHARAALLKTGRDVTRSLAPYPSLSGHIYIFVCARIVAKAPRQSAPAYSAYTSLSRS